MGVSSHVSPPPSEDDWTSSSDDSAPSHPHSLRHCAMILGRRDGEERREGWRGERTWEGYCSSPAKLDLSSLLQCVLIPPLANKLSPVTRHHPWSHDHTDLQYKQAYYMVVNTQLEDLPNDGGSNSPPTHAAHHLYILYTDMGDGCGL